MDRAKTKPEAARAQEKQQLGLSLTRHPCCTPGCKPPIECLQVRTELPDLFMTLAQELGAMCLDATDWDYGVPLLQVCREIRVGSRGGPLFYLH